MNQLDSNTVNIIDVIYFENLIIMYNEFIYCRWFYWELFDKLSVIYENKCILGGNTFYIIDDKKDNINSTHYNGYTFSTKNGKVLTLNEIGTPIQLYEDKEHTQLSLYFLHRITISYDDL